MAATDSPTGVTVTVQAPTPVQPPPDQPEKTKAVAGVAVKVTTVPAVKRALHVPVKQFIPAGDEVTAPTPAKVTESGERTSNLAVTVISSFIETVQLPVPLQPPPDQPM